MLHPGRRAPRWCPNLYISILKLCALYKRYQSLCIVLYREILHLKVTVILIVRIPVTGEIVCSYRHPANSEIGSIIRKKKLFHYWLAVSGRQQSKWHPAQFIKTCPESFDCLPFAIWYACLLLSFAIHCLCPVCYLYPAVNRRSHNLPVRNLRLSPCTHSPQREGNEHEDMFVF